MWKSKYAPVRAALIALVLITAAMTMLSCSKKEVKKEYVAPKEAYENALTLMDAREYEKARDALTEVRNRDDSKTYAHLAQLKMAETYIKDEEFELAIEEYRKFLKLYPDNKYAPYAQYQIASLYFNQIEGADRGYRWSENAIAEFNRLNEMFPRNPYREVIQMRIEKSKNILAAHEHYVARFYFKKGSFMAAIGRLRVVIDKYPEYKYMDDVYYVIGASFMELGKKEEAMEYLKKAVAVSTDKKLVKDAENLLSSLNKK
jgi:outer membrane protein assembly factor BamD